jgi:hypothetical protein
MIQKWDNLVGKKYGGAAGISDDSIQQTISEMSLSNCNTSDTKYIDMFKHWVNSSVNNTIELPQDWFYTYSDGTTAAFNMFYLEHRDKRFRVLSGEYFYHKIMFTRMNLAWSEIHNSDIKQNDAVIISLPFSNTGNAHDQMITILDNCARLGVPVLLDCCYFGQCTGLHFPLDHPAITVIAFSLSKCFDVPYYRIGMRAAKIDNDDGLFVYQKNGYTNKVAQHVGIELMSVYSSDYMVDKYYPWTLDVCDSMGIANTSCVNFGLSANKKYDYLSRGSGKNRINIKNEVKNIYNEKTINSVTRPSQI